MSAASILRPLSSNKVWCTSLLIRQYSAVKIHHQGILCTYQNIAFSTSSTPQWKRLIPPLPALTLGVSGLIPFFAPPLYMMYNDGLFCADGEMMHLAYSASILAFLGGVRWGLTLPDNSTQSPSWKNLTYSVMPALLAWAVILLQSPLGYIPVTAGLLACGVIDIAWPGYPPWFKILRFLLTSGALLSTFILFKIKWEQDKSLGVTKSIDEIKEKYHDWKNSTSQ